MTLTGGRKKPLLNKFRQFTTEIDGIEVHFIHEKGKGKNSRPLLLTHGWPDSFYRFYKVIPMLTDPVKYGNDPSSSFDVIVPSLPGFGFSEHTSLSNDQVANLWVKLMTKELGYRQFMAAGGDLGSHITLSLGRLFPEVVAAIHITEVGYPTGREDFVSMSPIEQQFLEFCQQWWSMRGLTTCYNRPNPKQLAIRSMIPQSVLRRGL